MEKNTQKREGKNLEQKVLLLQNIHHNPVSIVESNINTQLVDVVKVVSFLYFIHLR